ncbi:MAG: macro domain-containing protein [Porticoccaceae bacterium]|nr:macro domain-containing protein [Porticoccaceae bacterium]
MHRIKIHQGKVATLNVDAIVNPLIGKDSFDRQKSHKESSDKTNPNQFQSQNSLIGEIRIVPASADSPNAVIEVIGPLWRGGDYQEEEQLASCYRKAMDMAKKQNFRIIAFTPISGGAKGFPANRATKIAVQQVDSALRKNPLMEWVIFCCSDPVTTALYRTQVGR